MYTRPLAYTAAGGCTVNHGAPPAAADRQPPPDRSSLRGARHDAIHEKPSKQILTPSGYRSAEPGLAHVPARLQ